MDDTRPNSGAVIIEDIKSVPSQRCPGLKASADLAPVHCSSKVRMSEVAKRNDENCTDSLAHVNKNFKEKLILNDRRKAKNGVNLKLGYTDVEVHCGSLQNCIKDKDKESLKKNAHPVESNNLSSHNDNCKMDSSSDLIEIHSKSSKSNSTNLSLSNSNISNGYEISEENSSNSILDNSINSDTSNSLDVSHSSTSTGARSRIHNRSSSPLNVSQAEKIDAHVNKVSKLKNEDHSQIFMPVCKTIESPTDDDVDVEYSNYENEYQMESIMKLIQRDLSEPYSIYTYRYFIHNWPKLCFLASVNNEIIGAIVCKLDVHKKSTVRGYIAMLAVDQRFRKRKIGSNLVQRAIRKMATDDADEVVLETEITNTSALKLYENLGFVRDKRLFRYYLNGVDALRLKLWLT